MSALAAPRRGTSSRVWRGSYDVDDPRAQVARPFGDGSKQQALFFIDKYLATMREWALLTKLKGKAHALTHNMIATAETLLRRCTEFSTGHCAPRLDTIMRKTGFARPTVVAHLAALRELGFFDWVRRTVRTGNAPGEGPPVRQTSNAYFVALARLPAAALRGLRQKLGTKVAIDEREGPPGSGKPPPRVARLIARTAAARTDRATPLERELRDRREELVAAAQRAWAEADAQGASASSAPSLLSLCNQGEVESGGK